MEPEQLPDRVVALAGGVGGAKLADGLARVLPSDGLSVIVNTADDFQLHGLHISPDVDTVIYTLAGLANPETGWGIAGDTWNALDMLGRLGAETWFRIGDRDLALHVVRTAMMRMGASPTEVTARLARQLGVLSQVLPMTDAPVATIVETAEGMLEFQDYFVRRRHADRVEAVRFAGVEEATMPLSVVEAVRACRAIIFCPSNPIVSIGPILAVPGMRALLEAARVPVVAVSPIVGGRALKGPAADMMLSLGHAPTSLGVAEIYAGLVEGMVIDHADEELRSQIERLGMRVLVTNTVMQSSEDRATLATEVLSFAALSGPVAR